MEFPKRRIVKEQKSSTCDLTFFFEAPDCSVSLQEFEDYAVARLKLLRMLERVSLTAATKDDKEWREKVEHELSDLPEFQYLMKCRDEDELLRGRKFDHVSHYILRLAFSRTEELRRWFVNMEVEFFRYKFVCSADGNLAKDILEKQFEGTIKTFQGKREDILQDLNDTYFYINSSDLAQSDIYEVPFTQCLDLVKTRRVFLRNGKAYIFHPQLRNIVCSEFRRLLSKDLTAMSKIMPIIDEDERLAQILTDFDKRHTGSTYAAKTGTSKEVMTVEKLEQASTTSFPMCMKSLYDTVKKDYHLRHFGRLQLGLFFKGLGLPMDEATRFWRTNFTKKPGVDVGRFDKQYLYNIRHMYGQEGKRADYTPYSCMKIIMSSVGPGESHGCPFRHSDVIPLRVKLAEANIPASGVKEIMELVEKHHYQIACQRYFEWTHNKATVEGGVNHPNQYFNESQKVLAGRYKVKVEPQKPTTTRSSMYLKSEPNTNPDEWEDMDIELDDSDLMASLDEEPLPTASPPTAPTASLSDEKVAEH